MPFWELIPGFARARFGTSCGRDGGHRTSAGESKTEATRISHIFQCFGQWIIFSARGLVIASKGCPQVPNKSRSEALQQARHRSQHKGQQKLLDHAAGPGTPDNPTPDFSYDMNQAIYADLQNLCQGGTATTQILKAGNKDGRNAYRRLLSRRRGFTRSKLADLKHMAATNTLKQMVAEKL